MDSQSCLRRLRYAYHRGKPVASVIDRSPDAPFILEDDEFDYEWREARIDPQILPPAKICRASDFREIARYPAPAFTRIYPPLIFLSTGRVQILDGYHRIASAQHQDAAAITVLIAALRDASSADLSGNPARRCPASSRTPAPSKRFARSGR